MKIKTFIASVLTAAIIVTAPLAATPALSDDDEDYLIANVGITAVLTLVKSLFDGEVKSFRDAAKVFALGAVGGYGFFEAKKMAGRGDLTEGITLNYLSASFVENTAEGENPFAYIRYGLGPVDFNIATPWAKKDSPSMKIELNGVDTGCFIALSLESGADLKLRHGMMYFTTDEIEQDEDDDFDVLGVACGRTILYENDTEPEVIRHEFIHAIQFNQVDSVTAKNKYTFEEVRQPGDGNILFSLRLNWLYLTDTLVFNATTPYEDRWYEREAFQLAP